MAKRSQRHAPARPSSRRQRPIPRRAQRSQQQPPGALAPPPDAAATTARVMCYNGTTLKESVPEGFDALTAAISPGMVTWIDLVGQADIELFGRIRDHFNIHPLAAEDALTNYQRPKLEEYEEFSHLVVRMPNTTTGLYFEQVSIFWGKTFVITVQEREGDCLEPLRHRIRTSTGRIRRSESDYLVYAIIDAIMEAYVPLIVALGEQLERIEESILSGAHRRSMADAHRIRKDLHYMRRICIPTRELLIPLYREETSLVRVATRPYFRDCADHVMQILEMVEVEKEFCTQILDLHAMALNQRMNEVMKVLTLISTIFIPLSFVAGLYGMNFQTDKSPWNMPELRWYLGYPLVLLLMLGISGGLVAFFWRKGWIGRGKDPDRG